MQLNANQMAARNEDTTLSGREMSLAEPKADGDRRIDAE